MASIQERKNKAGQITFVVQIRRKEQESISRSFPTKALAKAWARKTEAEMDSNRYQGFKVAKASNPTLGSIIDRYFEEIGGSKGFGRNKAAVLSYLSKTLGHLKTHELTTPHLLTFVNDRIKAGASGVTIGIDLTYLNTVYKTADALWNISIDPQPIKTARASLGFKGISIRSRERTRRPTRDELGKLIAYFNARSRQVVPMHEIIPFAVTTAMRLGEIVSLRWEDLNENDKTIIIRNRKHPRQKEGNDQEVPLIGEAYDIAIRQPRIAPVIFPYSAETVSTIFPRACQALGIEDLRFHDLRHEGCSRFFEMGYTIEQVSLISGHRDWGMLRRYVQLRAKDLHRPLQHSKEAQPLS